MYKAIVCQIVADTWTYAFGTWYSLEFLLLIREKKSFKRCQPGLREHVTGILVFFQTFYRLNA